MQLTVVTSIGNEQHPINTIRWSASSLDSGQKLHSIYFKLMHMVTASGQYFAAKLNYGSPMQL